MDANAQKTPFEILWEAQKAAAKTGGPVFRSKDTPSMLGQLSSESYIVVNAQKEYAVGDDVTYKNANGGYTTHRVIAIKPGHVFPKGTFNKNGDGWIPLADVVGKVTSVH